MKRVWMGALMLPLLLTLLPVSAAALSGEPGVSAKAAILVDANTGRVLYEKNADERRAIASTTKLMTALVVAEQAPDIDKMVHIKKEWTGAEGTSLYLKEGDEITVGGLLYGLLMESGNDAAIALAGYCAGDVDTFVEWMNWKAEDLGMDSSHFANPNGLDDDGHYSTARDMALLGRAVMENETLAEIVATKSITMDGRSFSNHNKLLSMYDGCIGMKTGYTGQAGRTLVSCAERDGLRLIAVTLSAPDDWNDHTALFNYGFANYTAQGLALAGREVRRLPVTGSLNRFVTVATEQDVYYPLTQEEAARAEILLPQEAAAPVKKGEIAGELNFYLGDTFIGRAYLVYAQDVESDQSKKLSPLQWMKQRLFPGKKDTALTAPFPVVLLDGLEEGA